MPVLIRREPLGVEPHRAAEAFAHLGAGGGGDQRRRQAEQGAPVDPARQFDAGDDVAPLVGAAHLQIAAEAPGQLDEIVGLQDRVVEFEKRHRLVAVEPQLDAVLGQHAVDRKMPADVAQQRDVAQFVEPIGVVDHDRGAGDRSTGTVIARGAEIEEIGEDPADPRHVAGNLLVAQQLAGLIAPGWVADPRGAAAHQDDRLMAGPLKEAQQHDRHQMADMQTVGGTVVADIGGDRAGGEARVERLQIGALVDEAALGGGGEKGGTGIHHDGLI